MATSRIIQSSVFKRGDVYDTFHKQVAFSAFRTVFASCFPFQYGAFRSSSEIEKRKKYTERATI